MIQKTNHESGSTEVNIVMKQGMSIEKRNAGRIFNDLKIFRFQIIEYRGDGAR
jgi:hypothetical protein